MGTPARDFGKICALDKATINIGGSHLRWIPARHLYRTTVAPMAMKNRIEKDAPSFAKIDTKG